MAILADLATLLARSPEDVATEGLTLILNRSLAARSALDRLLAEWCGGTHAQIAAWRSQVVGADAARTDMEAIGLAGETVAIFENKFWAGLTDNQPQTYLERLPLKNGALAFVAPSVRVPVLKLEIANRARRVDQLRESFVLRGSTWVTKLASGRTVIVTSWSTIFDAIAQALQASNEYETLADLIQLKGLADKMELEGFRPFTSTDLTGNAPRLVLQACSLVDQAVALLLAQGIANKRGLRATGGQGWYGHYLRMHGYGCQLIFSAWRWAQQGISPMWFRISSATWTFPERMGVELRASLGDTIVIEEVRDGEWTGLWMPIQIIEGREESDVVADIVKQLATVASALGTHPELNDIRDPVQAS